MILMAIVGLLSIAVMAELGLCGTSTGKLSSWVFAVSSRNTNTIKIMSINAVKSRLGSCSGEAMPACERGDASALIMSVAQSGNES